MEQYFLVTYYDYNSLPYMEWQTDSPKTNFELKELIDSCYLIKKVKKTDYDTYNKLRNKYKNLNLDNDSWSFNWEILIEK